MTDCRRGTTGLLSATLKATLAFCSLIGTGTPTVKVDVRCFCNLPLCVATSYMCRSSAGVCVSEKGEDEPWRWRHSCLELVESRQMAAPICEENATRQCCKEDMCNYFGKTAPPSLSGHRKLNHSHVTGYLSNHDTSLLRGGGSLDPHPWFQVTVVAVPIAGGLVLVILIVMAIRMLRVERHRQMRLKPADFQVVYHEPRKNFLPKSLSCVLLGKGQTGHVVRSCASMGSIGRSTGSFCHSGSIAMSTDSCGTDSSREKYFVFDL